MKKIILFLACCFYISVFAQQNINLQWNLYHNQWDNKDYISIKNGSTTQKDKVVLPMCVQAENMSEKYKNVTVQLSNEVWADLSFQELAVAERDNWKIYLGNSWNSSLKIQINQQKQKTIAQITFIPIVYRNNTYKKLLSYTYTLQGDGYEVADKAASDYAPHSVLATGNWYKVAITQSGIYKLDKTFLTNLGLPSSFDPRNLRVYGSGGDMLPTKNKSRKINDLQENAIFVEGENDGNWDNGDYALFYAQGMSNWKYNKTTQLYEQILNIYSDTTYYFITTDLGIGKRITNQASANVSPTYTTNSYPEKFFHEQENVNLLKTGSKWIGEDFNTNPTQNYSFAFANRIPTEPAKVTVSVVGKLVGANTTMNITANSTPIGNSIINSLSGNYDGIQARESIQNFSYTGIDNTINVGIVKQTAAARVWLDYITINARCALRTSGDILSFSEPSEIGTAKSVRYNIEANPASTWIWETTDLTNITSQEYVTDAGNQIHFIQNADSLRQFLLVNKNGNYTNPVPQTRVSNQDLHAFPQCDMVIVVHPNFKNAAERLATLRRTQGLVVHVVTPRSIYNEFSSGMQEPTAIREFMRMFYERKTSSADAPKYLLLFGKGSFDNKNRTPNNFNYIPTYQSPESYSPVESYLSDDYYGLLDVPYDEGYVDPSGDLIGAIDIGIGRLLATTTAEADLLVNKIIGYENTPVNLKNWRQEMLLLADDEDFGSEAFIASVENLIAKPIAKKRNYHQNKVYFDSYIQEVNAGGTRYPQAAEEIRVRMNKGALIINYVGHGGPASLSVERVIERADFGTWENKDALTCVFGATCDFTLFDDPTADYDKSGGDLAMLNPNGGAVCAFSTTRIARIDANNMLLDSFGRNVIRPRIDGTMPTIGDIVLAMKPTGLYMMRNFILLGDPSMRLAYPQYKVVTTDINNHLINTVTDTLRALDLVKLKGFVADNNGTIFNNFNGTIYVTVYDKPVLITTLQNDPQAPLVKFKSERNTIYKGAATVTNGLWECSFVVPQDISLTYDTARIGYYAENGSVDAGDSYNKIVIGGISKNPVIDNAPPHIDLYMNNRNFVSGGTTNTNPTMLAFLSDDNGINTTSTGIGHDIVATLDGNTGKSITMNEFYQANVNDYKSGTITYPFKDIAVGKHTLTLKAWDIMNKSAEASIDFVVASTAEMALTHVLNYPNPFTTNTSFYFEHNQPDTELDVQIQIFSMSGKIVKTIETKVNTHAYRNDGIAWNGLDEFGDAIAKGTYMYRIKVKNPDGKVADQYEKLVILK